MPVVIDRLDILTIDPADHIDSLPALQSGHNGLGCPAAVTLECGVVDLKQARAWVVFDVGEDSTVLDSGSQSASHRDDGVAKTP